MLPIYRFSFTNNEQTFKMHSFTYISDIYFHNYYTTDTLGEIYEFSLLLITAYTSNTNEPIS